MKLTIEQLKSILFGAVDMAEENGRISLFRCTKKQRAYYSEKRGGELLYKTHASAGMRLDMHTDADALSFDFWVKKASGRTFYSIDLYVDGVFRESFYVNHLAVKSKGTVSFALPTGEHRVTVYLPNMMKTENSERPKNAHVCGRGSIRIKQMALLPIPKSKARLH